MNITEERADYARFLTERGFTERAVRALVDDLTDHIEMPPEFRKHVVKPSPIEGLGMFATVAIEPGDVAPARLEGRRTDAGRRTNHSPHPNCIFEPRGLDLMLVATKHIQPGVELTIDYRQAGQVNGWNETHYALLR